MTRKLNLLVTILLLTLALSHSRPELKSPGPISNDQLNGDSKNDYGYVLSPGPPGISGNLWGHTPIDDGTYVVLSQGGGVVCHEQGPCYMKKLTCPSECFKSFSHSDKGYKGGCIFDCKDKCMAYC